MIAAPVLALLVALQQDQAVLKEKLDKKLAEAWLTKAAWNTDFDKAKEESKKSGKPILAYFTRSYAY
jgi:hypothetical protein